MDNIKIPGSQFTSIVPEFIVILLSILFAGLLFLSIYYLVNIGNRYIERPRRINIDLRFIIKLFLFVLILYIIRLIFKKYSVLGDTFFALTMAIVISFIINPIVTYLENKGIKRGYGVLIVYAICLLIFTLLLVIVIPKTVTELSKLVTSLQDVFELVGNISNNINDTINHITKENSIYNFNTQEIFDSIEKSITNFIVEFQSDILMKLREFLYGVGTIFSKIFKFVLVFIFTFYFTVDKDKYKNLIVRNLPYKYKDDILYVSKRINLALLDFVKGRMLMAFIVGLATMVYLLVLRVDFAIVIGLITMIADIIPYIGPFLGFVPAVLFAYIDSPVKALWVAILFVVLQWAENNIIAPKLLGNKTGLNPLIILVAIIVGGAVLGVFGMIFSVPIASVIVILIDFIKIKYNSKPRNTI